MIIIIRLNPEYYQCSFQIFYFIIRLTELIRGIINDDIYIPILNLISEIISLISSLIYLELIELKFCGLNSNLKINIVIRSKTDYEMNNLFIAEN